MLTLQDLYLCDIPFKIGRALAGLYFCEPGEKAAFLAEIIVTIIAEDTDEAWEISAITIGDQVLHPRSNTFRWAASWLMENRIDELREHLVAQLPEAEAEAERERKYG